MRYGEAIEEPVHAIIDAIQDALDQCPPELAGDLVENGIMLTGGGALLRGLDRRLAEVTGMPIKAADNPLHSVASARAAAWRSSTGCRAC